MCSCEKYCNIFMSRIKNLRNSEMGTPDITLFPVFLKKLSLKKERGKLFARELGKEIVSFLFNRINGHIFAITVEN